MYALLDRVVRREKGQLILVIEPNVTDADIFRELPAAEEGKGGEGEEKDDTTTASGVGADGPPNTAESESGAGESEGAKDPGEGGGKDADEGQTVLHRSVTQAPTNMSRSYR